MTPFAVVIDQGYEKYEVWSGCSDKNCRTRHFRRATFTKLEDAQKFADLLNKEQEGDSE